MKFRRYAGRATFSMFRLRSKLEVRLGRSGTQRASAAGEAQQVGRGALGDVKRLRRPVGGLTISVKRLPRVVSSFSSFTNKFSMAVVRFREDALDRLAQLWIDRLRGDQLRQALDGLRAGECVRI